MGPEMVLAYLGVEYLLPVLEPLLAKQVKDAVERMENYGKALPVAMIVFWIVKQNAMEKENVGKSVEELAIMNMAALRLSQPQLTDETRLILIASALAQIQKEALEGK